MDVAHVYILRCADGSFYTGVTRRSVEARLSEHNAGLANGYTAKRLPVTLIYSEAHLRTDKAVAAERRIKGWSRAKKVALMQGEFEALQAFSERQSDRCNNTQHPHAEEARRAVSKHGLQAPLLGPSFETPASRAPQDEGS